MTTQPVGARDLLVRKVRLTTLDSLKERARRHGRSLQAELRLILEEAAGGKRYSFDDAVRFADEMRHKYAEKISGDSADIIREARDSR